MTGHPVINGFVRFPLDVVDELRQILGNEAADVAMPSLEFAATMYRAAVSQKRLSRTTRQELSRVDAALGRLLKIKLSPAATHLLGFAFDFEQDRDFVTGWMVLSAAFDQCRRARGLIRDAVQRPVASPATRLVYTVAGAIRGAHQPVSSSRDGVFARVVTVVWNAVDPDGVPEDVFPYVRKAAAHARHTHPRVAPTKGRPRVKQRPSKK